MFDLKNIQNYTFQVLLVLIICVYNWRRRFLYYHASKYKGPFSLPIIGSLYLFRKGYKEFYGTIENIIFTYPVMFKFWLGRDLFIITKRPQDIKQVLNNALDKGKYYDLGKELMSDGLLAEPVPQWKIHRKIINPSFNSKILNSFVEVFVKQSHSLVEELESQCDKTINVLPPVFSSCLDMACETLADVDVSKIKGREDFIRNVMRMGELMAIRIFRIWLQPNLIWKISPQGKEMHKISEETFEFIKNIVRFKKSHLTNYDKDDDGKDKRFLNLLLHHKGEKEHLTFTKISEETQTMLIGASETTALTVSMALVVLSLFPDVQEEIRSELRSIFGHRSGDVTLEDINKMVYLECVIKETMRLFPTLPLIVRSIHEDIILDSQHTIPNGSFVLIPIQVLHKLPDFWENPLQFNPHRFLNKGKINQHPCVYLPFSYGLRNCIGYKYGMMSMKVTLSQLLWHYRPKPVIYEKLDDIKLLYSIGAKPKDGYKIMLEKIY